MAHHHEVADKYSVHLFFKRKNMYSPVNLKYIPSHDPPELKPTPLG